MMQRVSLLCVGCLLVVACTPASKPVGVGKPVPAKALAVAPGGSTGPGTATQPGGGVVKDPTYRPGRLSVGVLGEWTIIGICEGTCYWGFCPPHIPLVDTMDFDAYWNLVASTPCITEYDPHDFDQHGNALREHE